MNELASKGKEVLYSVLPITILVLILNFTLVPLGAPVLFRFLLGAFLVVAGLAVFLLGVDIGITPIGNHMGSSITRSGKVWIVAAAGLVLGFFISVAEPDLHILAGQVDAVTSGQIPRLGIVAVVSAGIAIMLTLGLVRILFNIPLYKILIAVYLLIGGLAFFVSPEFLAISFDASGATTGALTVPFILALAVGVSVLKKDSKASEKDSFGLVAITSTGAILAVMAMSILSRTDRITGTVDIGIAESSSVFGPFVRLVPRMAAEVAVALLPILLLFLLLHRLSRRISRKAVNRTLIGLLFALIGLTLFLTGVNAGFMEVGSLVGFRLASLKSPVWLVAIGFLLGFVTVLAEPAVHVLTRQIEEVTSGYVRHRVVMTALSIGIGAAVALSMVRILIVDVKLWHFLLPGYAISLALTFFAPKLFVGMAFDSGGVSSGPMTATFILAFAQGAAHATEGADVLVDGFGMIAMVAMMPLITLQILGLYFKIKSGRRKGDV